MPPKPEEAYERGVGKAANFEQARIVAQMSVYSSIRHCSRSQLGSFRPNVVIVPTRQTRNLTISMRSRASTHSPLFRVPGCSPRSYWWSSRTTAHEPPLHVTEALQSDPISVPLKSTSDVTLNDSISNLAISEQALVNHESVVASVPDLPSSVIPPALELGGLKELGFCNFTPVGAIQASLEFIHVTTGLPWWGTITLATVLSRLVILHFTITSTRSSAKMAPLRPQMEVLMQEAKEAKIACDHLRLQIAAHKLSKLRKDGGFGLGSSFAGPFSQAVMSISMFIGIKKLCDFPLAQLKFESVAWLGSLSAPDPLYILPALSLALMNLQISLSKTEMAAGGQHMLHFSNAFRVLGIIFLPFVARLPAGLLIYLVTNIGLVAIQSRVLRMPAVRRALNIPPIPTFSPVEQPSIRDSWNALRQWFRNKNAEAHQTAREKANVPTFPTHPTITATPIRRNSKPTFKGRKD